VLYKSTNSTVVRKSTDGGAAFLAVGGALPFSFAGLTVSATNASMVYAYSSNPAALYVSTDGGNNWSPIETGLGAAAPSRVTVDPTNSSGAFLTASVSETAFLAKINPAGTGFVYSTFFGGISDAVGYGVATFGGDAFVAGDSLGSMPVTTPIFGGTTSAYAGLVVRVTDATAGCSYSVTPASQVTYGALDARTYTVVAPSGCSWSATSDQPWATILRGATSAGTGALFVQAQPNNTGTARTANLSVGGQIVTLVQSASSCTYYLSPPSATVGAGGGSVQMTVTAPPGCPWSVANSYPLTVSVVSGASGVGNGQVTLNVGPPASTNGATYNVSIAGLAFPITQSGSCLSVGAMNLSIGAAASSGSIAVTTSGNCPWTAVSDASWLTITAGASGSAGGSVTYSAAGDTGAARSATITIGPVVVTVNQAGVIAAGAPVVGDPSPAFGSGLQQTFTFNLSDPRGYQDLDVVNVLINNFLDGRRACYLAYSVSQSSLYLVDDAGDAGGPFAAGLQNSQCSVVLVSAAGNGTSLALTLKITFAGAFGGNRILYSAARDLEGGNSGWQAMGVWQVPYTPAGGIVVSGVSPARGSGLAGTATGYTIQLTDAKGTADIGVVNLLVNNAIDGRAACYLAYSATSNAIFLVDDPGDAGGPFVGSLALNGQGVIQNSQCVVNGAGTSVAANGSTLTVNLNLSFKGTFAGNRILYAAGRDHQDGNNTDWQPLATWSVQ